MFINQKLQARKRVEEELSQRVRLWTAEGKLQHLKHLVPYITVKTCLRPGTRILDAGCNLGYGVQQLLGRGADYVGIDTSKGDIALARAAWGDPSVCFSVADCQVLPFGNDFFDIVVAFQVLEHLPRPYSFLTEARRVLRPSGVLVMTTPNRCFRLLPFQKPWNKEHLREYRRGQLRRALRRVFPRVVVGGLLATPETMKVEHNLVKQDWVKVYSSMIPGGHHFYWYWKRIKQVLSSKKENLPKPRTSLAARTFSAKDFGFARFPPRVTIDLVTICSRDPKGHGWFRRAAEAWENLGTDDGPTLSLTEDSGCPS